MHYPLTFFVTPDGESHFEASKFLSEAGMSCPGRPGLRFLVLTRDDHGPRFWLHIGAPWDGSWHPTPQSTGFCVTLFGPKF